MSEKNIFYKGFFTLSGSIFLHMKDPFFHNFSLCTISSKIIGSFRLRCSGPLVVKSHFACVISPYRMRHQQNALRQVQPRSRADFDMLYNLIERWRSDRFQDIKTRLFKAAQRAENYGILEKTVEMLHHIDKHKQTIRSLYRRRRFLRFLTFNCKPIRWNGYKGIPLEMITVKIQKAREFKGLYDALSDRDVGPDERMVLLIMLRKSIKEHDCMEAFDLLSLLDQDIALLTRGITKLSLGCLNKRITRKRYGTMSCNNVVRSSGNGTTKQR